MPSLPVAELLTKCPDLASIANDALARELGDILGEAAQAERDSRTAADGTDRTWHQAWATATTDLLTRLAPHLR